MKKNERTIKLSIFMILFLFLIMFPLINSGYWLHLLSIALIYTILALSLNLLYGFAGQISFGHAGFFAMGAYIQSILEKTFSLGFEISFLITIVVCFLISYMIAFPVLKLKDHYLGMATLAFGLLIFTIAMQWVTVTGGPSGMIVPHSTLFGMSISKIIYFLIVIFTFLTYIIAISIYHSKMGYALRAIADDEWAAKASGINVVQFKTLIFSISGVIASLAGILYSKVSLFISPEAFSLHVSILILTMVVIGGLGSNTGAVIGAVFLTIIPEIMNFLADYQTIFYGALLLFVLIFMPGGLVKLPQMIKSQFQKKKDVVEDVKGG